MTMVDLQIRGGEIVTMNASREVKTGDVWCRDGIIVSIGAPPKPRRATQVIDARGCAVLPGLIQTHVHLCQTLFRGAAEDRPLLAWLRDRIWPLEAAHDPRSLRASARLGLAEMLRAGTTSILDMGTVHHHDAVFEAMEESGVRGASGKAMMDVGRGVPHGLRESTKESVRESERLIKRWHGRGRIRYALAPRFILSCSPRLWRETVALAQEHRVQIHTHAAEHAEERAAVKRELGQDDIAALREYGVFGPTAVLAHCVQLRGTEIRRMAKEGTHVVHCPSANMKLASGIAPIRQMRNAGIVVGLGADGAPCNNRLDPWTELRQAALLAKIKDRDATALPAQEALAMLTIDGARILGLDSEVGSIELGKRADLCIVRLDAPHTEPAGDVITRLVYSATAHDVQHVFIDGQAVVRNRELVTLDQEHVTRTARNEIRRLLRRAKLG